MCSQRLRQELSRLHRTQAGSQLASPCCVPLHQGELGASLGSGGTGIRPHLSMGGEPGHSQLLSEAVAIFQDRGCRREPGKWPCRSQDGAWGPDSQCSPFTRGGDVRDPQ